MVKETKDFVSRLFTSTIAWLPIGNMDKGNETKVVNLCGCAHS